MSDVFVTGFVSFDKARVLATESMQMSERPSVSNPETVAHMAPLASLANRIIMRRSACEQGF